MCDAHGVCAAWGAVLAVGDAPEGLVALERRGLFVASNEDDGSLSVFGLSRR